MQHRQATRAGFIVASLAIAACSGDISPPPDGREAPPSGASGRTGRTAGSLGASGGGVTGSSGAGGGAGAATSDPDPNDLPDVPSPRFARLTHNQWENATRDLLRLDAAPGLASSFTGDPSPGRFNDDGNTLQVTSQLRLDYQAAAETLADRVAASPAMIAKLLPANAPADPAAKSKAFLQTLGLRAYRRPLTDAELSRYQALFASGATIYKSADPFADGVRLALRAFLQSPHFLYRTELGPAGTPLGPYEVAAKLALALARTIPDDALLASANAGQLAKQDQIRAAADRLLGGGRLEALVDDFHDQALRLQSYAAISKDAKTFPMFAAAAPDLRAEPLAFARAVASDGGSFADLMTAPYSFVTKRTAPIYDLGGNFGDQMQKTALDPTRRAGLLTQLGFLASHAASIDVDTGLIHRGVFVMRQILCAEINAPGNIDFAHLPPGRGATNRARMDDLTSAASCKGCHHSVINPLGGAFEGFDAIGHARTTERDGTPITTAGSVAYGDLAFTFDGPVQLAAALARDRGAQRCYASGWLEYLHGHLLGRADAPLVADLATRSLGGQLPVRAMIVDLVSSDSFLRRAP